MSDSATPLSGTGVSAGGEVHANLTAPGLIAHALRRGEGRLSEHGAFIAVTGQHTGRSVQDKFVADDPSVSAEVWWGRVNQKMAPEKFAGLAARIRAFLGAMPELFTQDLYAGADPAHRIRVRLVTTHAWHALFARNMFLRPAEAELEGFEPDYVILHAPEFEADPARDGCRSGTCIALSFEKRLILIAGTSYAGEIKKSVFTVMNWILPPRGVLPMHCSANVGAKGDVALFFGLVRHRQDNAEQRPRPPPDRRRRARLVGRGRVQLRRRLLREGDPPLARGRTADLGRRPPLRHCAGECGGRPPRAARSRRCLADRKHPRLLPDRLHPQYRSRGPRRAPAGTW